MIRCGLAIAACTLAELAVPDVTTFDRGACHHAIGTSRGGRTTKIHALSDDCGRPVAFVLTPGNAHDLAGAKALLAIRCPPTSCWSIAPMMQRAYATGSSTEEQSQLSRPIPRANTRTVTTETPIAAET
jgi:hypothetical protein